MLHFHYRVHLRVRGFFACVVFVLTGRSGCRKTFNEPLQVMRHEGEDHPHPVARRPRPVPRVPSLPPRLGLPPRQLPSHRVVPRRVRRATISAERHAVVGPWVRHARDFLTLRLLYICY